MGLKSTLFFLTMLLFCFSSQAQEPDSGKNSVKEKPINISGDELQDAPSILEPNGLHCSRLQLLSASHQPVTRKVVSLSQQFVKLRKRPGTVLLVRYVELKPRLITDEKGILQLPALKPGNYLLQFKEGEEPAWGEFKVPFPEFWKPEDCSQVFVEEDGKESLNLRSLP